MATRNLDDEVTVSLPGGQLMVSWRGGNETVWLSGDAEFISEGIDIGIVFPKTSGACLERFPAFGCDWCTASWIGHPINQGDTNAGFTECLGCAPTSPSGSDDDDMGWSSFLAVRIEDQI